MSLFDSARPHLAGYRDVAPADVKLPAQGFRVVDVREPHEYKGELGHVPGSALVPMHSVMAQAMDWSRDEALVLVCRSGGRSAQVAHALTRAGFGKVMNLVGGMLAWNAAGLPVEK
ncbi:MAG: rhodanese-like domain-containing protein [Myxococcales bacterium]|nr:rhodanese-like domain-containing protein [Myxococcales bacterium]